MNYKFAFSVLYCSASASTHQHGGNEIRSLALIGDPTEKGACVWHVG